MKKNLLPTMQKVKLKDKEGRDFQMEIELRRGEDRFYVFLADTHELGGSRLAQDAMYYIEKIGQRLNLDLKNTVFYRHIYQEAMGSSFGHFQVDWQHAAGPTYRFRMLGNVDELQGVHRILAGTMPVSLKRP